MPTVLNQRYAPTWGGRPPHMSLEDFPIWLRYYPRHQSNAIALYFDVGLGLPDELPQGQTPELLLGWIKLNQKRADALIELPLSVLLVELRFNAQSNAIGRLLLYRQLLEQDNPFGKAIHPVLVTNRPDSEVKALAQSVGVSYEVV